MLWLSIPAGVVTVPETDARRASLNAIVGALPGRMISSVADARSVVSCQHSATYSRGTSLTQKRKVPGSRSVMPKLPSAPTEAPYVRTQVPSGARR